MINLNDFNEDIKYSLKELKEVENTMGEIVQLMDDKYPILNNKRIMLVQQVEEYVSKFIHNPFLAIDINDEFSSFVVNSDFNGKQIALFAYTINHDRNDSRNFYIYNSTVIAESGNLVEGDKIDLNEYTIDDNVIDEAWCENLIEFINTLVV